MTIPFFFSPSLCCSKQLYLPSPVTAHLPPCFFHGLCVPAFGLPSLRFPSLHPHCTHYFPVWKTGTGSLLCCVVSLSPLYYLFSLPSLPCSQISYFLLHTPTFAHCTTLCLPSIFLPPWLCLLPLSRPSPGMGTYGGINMTGRQAMRHAMSGSVT